VSRKEYRWVVVRVQSLRERFARMTRRVRQHVNPFHVRGAAPRPDWASLFPGRGPPLEVEIGCGKGTFLIARAQRVPERSLVGLEIREPVAERALARIRSLGQGNVHVIHCNAKESFASLFDEASLERVYLHFPDPWFKRRHWKRRILTRPFVDVLATRLRRGGELHFMTDHAPYAESVRDLVLGHGAFRMRNSPDASCETVLPEARSDREALHAAKGDRVYRYVFERVAT
jgi:tRNA (guanine-N7-)-methyltransferase